MSEHVGQVLVIGATASIGRLVTSRLQQLGDQSTALVRDTGRAHTTLGSSVDLVEVDMTDPSSLRSAVDDAKAVILTHGAPYGSGDYETVDHGAIPVLESLDGRSVRVALMTSIGVTGTGGSSRDLLNWKYLGERLLRVSALPYTPSGRAGSTPAPAPSNTLISAKVTEPNTD